LYRQCEDDDHCKERDSLAIFLRRIPELAPTTVVLIIMIILKVVNIENELNVNVFMMDIAIHVMETNAKKIRIKMVVNIIDVELVMKTFKKHKEESF
jgi:hypothetical protein